MCDSNRTLRNHGWIYGCFEPVLFEQEDEEERNICFQDNPEDNNYVLCKKALSGRSGGSFVEYLNATSNFLNALNLMASEVDVLSHVNHARHIKQLRHKEEVSSTLL